MSEKTKLVEKTEGCWKCQEIGFACISHTDEYESSIDELYTGDQDDEQGYQKVDRTRRAHMALRRGGGE